MGGDSAKHLVLLSREMRKSSSMNFLLANVQPSGSYIRAEPDPQGINNCVFFSHILGDSSGTETQSH